MTRFRWTAMLAVGVLFAACGDTTGPEEMGDPPVLPEVESLLFDLDFFSDGAGPAAVESATGAERQAGPGLNWAAAALSVGVANLAVVIHMAVPVATWRAATLRAPVFEDGQWHWRFSVAEGGATYAGDLAGFVQDGDAVFEMRVSSSVLGLSDFLWYTGRAPIGGTTGEWRFYDPDAPSSVMGRIEWTHPGTAVWSLTFFAESGEGAGDTLAYEVEGTARWVTFFDASKNVTVEVHWDAGTREGYIIAPGYNGGDKACWDGSLANIACST